MNRNLFVFKPLLSASLIFLSIITIYASPPTVVNDSDSTLPKAAKADQKLLFQQVSASSTLVPINSKKGTYVLSLKSPSHFITFFTDEPERYTGIMPLSEFYQHWGKGHIFKKAIEPNAVLEAYDKNNKTHLSRTVTLSAPTYNTKTNTVSYKITLLGEQKLPPSKTDLKYTVLFIDDFHWGGNRFDPGGG